MKDYDSIWTGIEVQRVFQKQNQESRNISYDFPE